MGKTKTSGKGRLDKFYYLAKEQGYRSRASFKLIQLNRKYQFLEKSTSLLDLCAAPGGWLQVAVKYMPVASLIVGVDLVPIRAIRGCQTLTEDITTPKCRAEIKKLLKDVPLDVVLHDGSPNVGGAWAKEALSQLALTLDALKLACTFLKAGGIFVTKVFRSQDYHSLIHSFKQLFKRVEATKPVASRATSAEIYVICMGFKSPHKLDPHLFDVRHVFKEVVEPPKVVDVLSERKQKRHREGYEDGAVLMNKSACALDFITSPKPVEFLGTIHCLQFASPGALEVAALEATDEEVKSLCADLRVLGKAEFRQLLKWRVRVRKAAPDLCSKGPPAAEAVEEPGSDEEKSEGKELEAMQAAIQAKAKERARREKKRQTRLRKSSVFGMNQDATGDGELYGEDQLFSLVEIKSGSHLKSVEAAAVAEDPDDSMGSGSEEEEGGGEEDGGESGEEEEAGRERYVTELEEYFDTAYEEFCRVREGSSKRRTRARARLHPEAEAQEHADAPAEQGRSLPALPEADTTPAPAPNPLLVALEETEGARGRGEKAVAQSWFSQDLFQGFVAGSGTAQPGLQAVAAAPAGEDSGESSEEDQHAVGPAAAAKVGLAEAGRGERDGFEVVKAGDSDSSSETEESEWEEYDSDGRAETLAYAARMVRKKGREGILDDAYNKRTFNDEGLPRWFQEDQHRFYTALKPITKEEVQAMKEQERAINARPVKKVAEAKARKRRVAMRKLEVVKKKATAISDQPDLTNRSKNRMMESLYKNHAKQSSRQGRKKVVVARKGAKGSRGRASRGSIMVDSRMRADTRGEERAASKKKGKGGKGASKGKGKGTGKGRGKPK